MMLEGFDCSHYQGYIDWPAAKGGASFAFIKASEGVDMTDARYHSNVRRAASAGVIPGAYHFFLPTRDATEQAKHYLQVVGSFLGMLPPVIDLETQGDMDPADYRKSLSAWLHVVETETGHKAIIYTYPDFGERMLADAYIGHSLWIAAYRPEPVTLAWPKATFWQYSEHGSFEGVPGAGQVDLDRFLGSEEELKALVVK